MPWREARWEEHGDAAGPPRSKERSGLTVALQRAHFLWHTSKTPNQSWRCQEAQMRTAQMGVELSKIYVDRCDHNDNELKKSCKR